MAQLSVANYFNNRKRPLTDEGKAHIAKKVLILDEDNLADPSKAFLGPCVDSQDVKNKIISVENPFTPKKTPKKIKTPRSKLKTTANQGNIRHFLNKADGNICMDISESPAVITSEGKVAEDLQMVTTSVKINANDKPDLKSTELQLSNLPMQPTNTATVKQTEPTLTQIAQKLSQSSRLAEIRASIARLQKGEQKLEAAKQKTQQSKDALVLKSFKAIELEINISPQKFKSPEKPYLSPKKITSPQKDLHGVRKNLFGLSSPVKKEIPQSNVKPLLTLPFKYRCLMEVFRAFDTVCQILHNRRETITFNKLKPAVEELLKRNVSEKHLAQIAFLLPEAFTLRREKLNAFGTGFKNHQWELVVVPVLQHGEQFTPEILLERRRKLFKMLINKVKDYHHEFLVTLDPPMVIDRNKITRWHPLFDIESVPDIESVTLPPAPNEEKFTSGHQVLEKARELFSCNTRMERALERLQSAPQDKPILDSPSETSILKGIPKALLEKVRQKQAAKALESMTRSAAKDKEVDLYVKLPEIARLTRNLFVTEKKSVLPLDLVLEKLCNSYRVFLNRNDMETFLRTIAKEIKDWLVFHEIRGELYLKLSKNTDLNLVMNKLHKLAESKDT